MKILLIEDDDFFREFYALKLKEKGVEVDVAEDGEEGLKKADENKPDIILLDLIMPKKDGFEVLQALSSQNLIPEIPVLVFSTLGQDEDIKKAIELGARDCINKSYFDFEKLFSKILEITNI